MKKSDESWKAELSAEAYRVARQGGTEYPGTGKYNNFNEPGLYKCICCNAPLFTSNAKFDSGCGWPAYYEPVSKDAMIEILDKSHGMIRTEVRCARCDAHLGHLFNDGPAPTGMRYCINSVCLDFEKK